MDIELSSDYRLELDSGVIRDHAGVDVSGQFLSRAYDAHVKSSFLLKGLLFRLKFWCVRTFLATLYSGLSLVARATLRLVSGERYQKKYDRKEINTVEDIYYQKMFDKKVNIVPVEGDVPIKFMDIQVNAFSAASYSALHLMMATCYIVLNLEIELVGKILGNVFLSLAYVVLSLYLWEKAIPRILRKSVIHFSSKSVESANSNIKV